MTEDQDSKDSQSDSGGKIFTNKSKDKRSRLQKPFTKVIVRRLPPTMSEETFLEQVSPIPEYDHFCYTKPDPSLGINSSYSRAYINFVNVDEIYLFRDKFDGYVFVDDKGLEYVGIVEYAPFQRIPKKKKKKDPKCDTIESDPVYQEFLESLNEQETETQPKLEYSYPVNDANDKKAISTPLLDYLAARKLDKRTRDDRRRRDVDKRKLKILKPKDGSFRKTYKLEEKCEDISANRFGLNINFKSKSKPDVSSSGQDTKLPKNTDWELQFPALLLKPHNTFTLTSDKLCVFESNEKSAGDTSRHISGLEEDDDIEYKKKPLEWENKSRTKEEYSRSPDDKDSGIEFKGFRGKTGLDRKKKFEDKKEEVEDDKKDRRDKYKESPKEIKSKKYSETRKERLKQFETLKSETPNKDEENEKVIEVKVSKSINQDNIKPFTQLPHVKADDLIKVINEMDRKMKLEEQEKSAKSKENGTKVDASEVIEEVVKSKVRRDSSEAAEENKVLKEEFNRQNSYDDSSREDSVEKEKGDISDKRSEKRIRNKDRPSLVIYQPGMGKFSKQRLAKEKDSTQNPAVKVNDSEKRDT